MKKSRKDKWKIELDVLCLLLWSDPKAWLVVLLRGQWSAPPSLTKPLFITSLISKVCGSQLKPGSAALGAWGEALCFFPFVVDLNHPFETYSQCFPSMALGSFVGNSADTERVMGGTIPWGLQICCLSAPPLLFFVFLPSCSWVWLQCHLWLLWREAMSSLSPLLGHPFPQAVGLISNGIRSFGCWVWLCNILMEVWAELSEYLMHSRRSPP